MEEEQHESTEFFVRVLRELKDIKVILSKHTKQLFDLQATVDSLTNKSDEPVIAFPAKTIEEFDEIEELMKENEGREYIAMQLRELLKNCDDMWLLKIIEEPLIYHFNANGSGGKRSIYDSQVIRYAVSNLKADKRAIVHCMTRVKDRNSKRKTYNSKKMAEKATTSTPISTVQLKTEEMEKPCISTNLLKTEVSSLTNMDEVSSDDDSQNGEKNSFSQSNIEELEIVYEDMDQTELLFPIKSMKDLKMMDNMMNDMASRKYLTQQLKMILEKNSHSWICDIIDESLLIHFTMNEKEGKRCLLHLKMIEYAISNLKASKRSASYWIRKVKDKIGKRRNRVDVTSPLEDFDDSVDDNTEIILEEDLMQEVEDVDEHHDMDDVKDTQLLVYLPQSSMSTDTSLSRKRKKRHFFFPAMTPEDIELMEDIMADELEREDLIFQLEARVERDDDMWLLKLIDDNLLVDYNITGKMGKRNIFELSVVRYAINYLETTKQSVSYAIRKAKDKIYHRKTYRKRQDLKKTLKDQIESAEDIIEEDGDDDKEQHYEDELQD